MRLGMVEKEGPLKALCLLKVEPRTIQLDRHELSEWRQGDSQPAHQRETGAISTT